jgi:hypothetical protein
MVNGRWVECLDNIIIGIEQIGGEDRRHYCVVLIY